LKTLDLRGFDVLFAGTVPKVQEDIVIPKSRQDFLVHWRATHNPAPSINSEVSK
jgi:hypothetical protein